jgi:NADPH:quinone reductase-like Zn-dependent oxidoreductase
MQRVVFKFVHINQNLNSVMETATMKASVYTQYGSTDVLHIKEVAIPTPKDNEILIKVHATTVNRTDCGFLIAEYFLVRLFWGLFRPKKHILGTEFAGEIVSIGKDVQSFKVGDAVFGLSADNFGAHAQYLCMPEKGAVALKPKNLDYQQAAAICEGAYLAMNYYKTINLQRGQKILINGATGSIGSAGVQLAKYFGADITAVGNTKNLDLVKSLGANRVVDYQKEDFTKLEDSYDFVFDAVGKSSFFKTKHLLKRGGVYFSTELGFAYINPILALLRLKFDGKSVIFPIPSINQEQVLFFKKLVEEGHYKAVIDKIYPFEKIVEAYKYVQTGQKTGNVVVTVG